MSFDKHRDFLLLRTHAGLEGSGGPAPSGKESGHGEADGAWLQAAGKVLQGQPAAGTAGHGDSRPLPLPAPAGRHVRLRRGGGRAEVQAAICLSR